LRKYEESKRTTEKKKKKKTILVQVKQENKEEANAEGRIDDGNPFVKNTATTAYFSKDINEFVDIVDEFGYTKSLHLVMDNFNLVLLHKYKNIQQKGL
jgi:hypothetical protein